MLPCATTCPQAVCIFTQPMPRFHSGSLLQYQCKARTRQTSATKQTNKCSTYVIAEAHNSMQLNQLRATHTAVFTCLCISRDVLVFKYITFQHRI